MNPKEFVDYYQDGTTVRSRGYMADGEMDGYWEFFRKDGTKMRSGSFRDGKQVGEWITFDRHGEVYKVTHKG